MPFLTERQNIDAILIEFAKLVAPTLNKGRILDELQIHPDYPSLLSISDVLNSFGIKSSAYQVPASELIHAPLPIIANVQNLVSEFVLVTELTQNTITITDQSKKNQTLNLKQFAKTFTGIILAIDDIDSSPFTLRKSHFEISGIRTIIGVGLLSVVGIIGISLFLNLIISPILGLVICCKLSGVIVTTLLLIQDVDKNNPLIQKLCGRGRNSNCNAILSSNAANVFPGLSWSDVGFFYFSGSFLVLIFSYNQPGIPSLLTILNLVSLPYTFYSIYYQSQVAKQWCILCCAVQSLLWIEFLSFMPIYSMSLQMPDLRSLSIATIGFGLPIGLTLLTKPIFLIKNQFVPLKAQLRKFKYNSSIFNLMLNAQPNYELPDKQWCITLGSNSPSSILTMVSNPYCTPCAQTHKILHEILNYNPGIQIRILFAVNNLPSDQTSLVARHLMALNDLPDKQIVYKALQSWYRQPKKNYLAWAIDYPVELNENQNKSLAKQIAWCELAEVKATPTLHINGQRLPDEYQINDIKYLLN